jgi:5-methylcytosine-specific restriction endonuclease McrA
MQTKVCKKCGKEFPATKEYFYSRPELKDGLNGSCKICVKNRPKKQQVGQGYRKCTQCGKVLCETEENFRFKKHMGGYIFYATCKECEKVLKRKYKEVHKEEVSNYNKLWNKNNKAARIKLNKKYYINNKESENARTKKYAKMNPEKINNLAQLRRAKLNNTVATFNESDWDLCKKEFNYACAYCGKKKSLAKEHFIPLYNGGEYTKNNIIPSCKSCNSSKSNKDFEEWYPLQEFYNKKREAKIYKYLNYKNGIQQLSIL